MEAKGHVVSLVLNGVKGDSRVIKTAKAAVENGYRATIVGLGSDKLVEEEIEGASVVLVPHPVNRLKEERLWPNDKERRHLWLLVEGAVKAMAPTIVQLAPDILHSHDMSCLRIGAALSRRLAIEGRYTPWIHDLHEYVVGLTTVPEGYRLSSMEYERRYLKQANQLLTVSDKLATEVQAIYHLRRPPAVVYNAPYLSEASPGTRDIRSDLGLSPKDKLVVYIGVAKRERGCETIVRAVAALPGVHICFVSDSRYVDAMRVMATGLGMADRFHSVPYVPSDEVVSYIRTADVGTHGLIHYPNGEVAMPNKMFEYLLARLPMVVSDVAEMKRFVTEHGIGEVFEAENAIDCAFAIRRVLDSGARYAAKITPALQQLYCWQTQAKKLGDIYDRLMAERDHRRALLLTTDPGSAAPVEDYDVGHVGNIVPGFVSDLYMDPTVPGDRHGIASLIAARYHTVYASASSSWPSALDRQALEHSGTHVVDMNRPEHVTPPAPRPVTQLRGTRLMADVENAYREIDEVALAERIELGKQQVLAGQTLSDATAAVALEAARIKIEKLVKTIKKQKYELRALASPLHRLKTRLKTFRSKLAGPAVR